MLFRGEEILIQFWVDLCFFKKKRNPINAINWELITSKFDSDKSLGFGYPKLTYPYRVSSLARPLENNGG